MNDLKNDNELMVKIFSHTISDDPQIRAAAYKALSNFQPQESVVTCLMNGINDEEPLVRKAAGASLISLGYLNINTH